MIRLCEDGVDADELPNGRGEFGWDAANPVPCNTVAGSTVYLGRLRTPDGANVVYKRVAAVASDVSRHPVDAYELSPADGRKLRPVFVSAYQKRNSNRAPSGLKLAPEAFIWQASGGRGDTFRPFDRAARISATCKLETLGRCLAVASLTALHLGERTRGTRSTCN
jgi:hypothetical protein